MLFVRLHPLFDIFNLFLEKGRDLRGRGGEGNNGDLRDLRVQVGYV